MTETVVRDDAFEASSDAAMSIVRVAVLAGTKLSEVALPAELPLREIVPAVERLLAVGGDDDTAARRMSLAPIGGAPFSLDATLDTVGVVDGDLLALQPVPTGPAAPGIVEDIADAAVIFSATRAEPWGPASIQRGALWAALGFVVIATVLSVLHRTYTGGAVGLYAVSALAAVVTLVALVARPKSAAVFTGVSAVALVPIAAAFALAVPGEFGSAQILLAAAGVTAWSLISMIVAERGVAFFTTTTLVGAGVLLAAGTEALWNLPIATVGAGLVILALLVTVSAAQLSALWARFPLPVIPAPGDPTPSTPGRKVLEDLPRRVRLAESHQTGFIAAGVLLAVAGSLAIAHDPATVSPWAWFLVVAACLGATLRARVWDSAPCKAWLLAHSYLVTATLLIVYTVTSHYLAAAIVSAVLTVLVAAWVVVALNPSVGTPETYSLPMRRMVGFLAATVDASLIPVAAYLVGLFDLVLNR